MKRTSHLILTRGHNSPKWYFKTKRDKVLKKISTQKLASHIRLDIPRKIIDLLPIVGPNPQSILKEFVSQFSSKNFTKIVKTQLQKKNKNNIFLRF